MQFTEEMWPYQDKLLFITRVVSASEVQDELNRVVQVFNTDGATLISVDTLLLQAGKVLITIAYFDR